MQVSFIRLMIAATFWLTGLGAMAIDMTSLSERYGLVGIISSNTKTQRGIVVIRDKEAGRTYTIRSGDQIPKSDNVRVHNIGRRSITLTTRGNTVRLSYGGSAVKREPKREETRLVNLTDLENFYRERSVEPDEGDVNRWPKVDLEKTMRVIDDEPQESAKASINATDDDEDLPNDEEAWDEGDVEAEDGDETTSISPNRSKNLKRDFMTYEEYRKIYSKQFKQQNSRKQILH